MDNLDDSENNAKISDSGYSNSCSNSQSRRSHSSKSNSGSNSSGSSGYGGKPSTSGSSNNLGQPETRGKDKKTKKKKAGQTETFTAEQQTEQECRPPEPPTFETPMEEAKDVVQLPSPSAMEQGPESMDICTPDGQSVKDEVVPNASNQIVAMSMALSRPSRPSSSTTPIGAPEATSEDGFSCVISMHDGVVMYTTLSLTTALGFPKDLWIGRSFIDFVHPRDRNTFASQITNGLAIPKNENGTIDTARSPGNSSSTMFCRIRRYRGLASGFGVKDRGVSFLPFHLKLSFKSVSDDEGKITYLVIQATPFFSAYRVPNEIVCKVVPFVIRHAANGNLEYIDPDSVPYLGYLPQDIADKEIFHLYHPDDLGYIRQMYEIVVKEGNAPRSRPYRMMAQNGEYLKVETEWSSFINPWSRKLEFINGKHYVVEGPYSPDVLQSIETPPKLSEQEKNNGQYMRDTILRVMNEVLTKPAEMAKQLMSKRCQDLASFMESLMEEQPKMCEDELRLEIQDADHSCYERDSVMLGGISPHHDYNDGKSSTETPLSYNQINYKETLQKYFDSHKPTPFEDSNITTGESLLPIEDTREPKIMPPVGCLSPMALNSRDSGEVTSSSESAMMDTTALIPLGDYTPVRLTESVLNKHNTEMERELILKHRENRSTETDKDSSESRQRKLEQHLARCNATYHPTSVAAPSSQPHGVKRPSKHFDSDIGHKHHCTALRQLRRKHTSHPADPPSASCSAAQSWALNNSSNMNPYASTSAMHTQVPLPAAVVPGMIPMYYMPTPPVPSTSDMSMQDLSRNTLPVQAMPYMMYGQAVFGPPFVYSPITPQVTFPMQPSMVNPAVQFTSSSSILGLTSSNYEEACKASVPQRHPKVDATWRDKKREKSEQPTSSKDNRENSESAGNTSENRRSPMDSCDVRSASISPKSTDGIQDTTPSDSQAKARLENSEESVDRTDGESSYSSFYSSFFKTESGSAEESTDHNKKSSSKSHKSHKCNKKDSNGSTTHDQHAKKVARRKMEPPWMEQVCVTSELIYRYQILTKSLEEVLSEDKKKISTLEQPALVNEQLGQLYLDLQLEGVAARLTLEEGITSSGSSGEESFPNENKTPRRKREYSKLVMIYEEDAPLPPPPPLEEDLAAPGTSAS